MAGCFGMGWAPSASSRSLSDHDESAGFFRLSLIALTLEQSKAVEAVQQLLEDDAADVFILAGSAGTGKTTMIGRLTGTPIEEKNKKKTREIFGACIDRYLLRDAEADGAILKILYEGRELKADVTDKTKPRRRYHKAQDAAALPLIERLVAARPTYGDRRIMAVLNWQLRSQGLAPVNHKRVYRIMKANSLLLARKYTERPEHAHDGKVIVLRSNLRWCSDGFELTCLNGDIIRGAGRRSARSGKAAVGHDSTVAKRCVASSGMPWRWRRKITMQAYRPIQCK